MPTTWTTQANPTAEDVAILLPGSGYTAQAPLLYWCAELLAELGWQTRVAAWVLREDADADPAGFVSGAVEEGFRGAGGRRLIVAKSFGTLALPWAQQHGVAGVWLTPLLTDDAVAKSLRDATDADFVVGGDADPYWRPDRIRGTGAVIRSVPEADHSLRVSAGWRASPAGEASCRPRPRKKPATTHLRGRGLALWSCEQGRAASATSSAAAL